MSEYQSYEFVALDGPISEEGMCYARSCSSRAEVSRFRWHNVYNFGSFHGDVDRLLKYYDAHFYSANWGTVCLALAFPKGSLQPIAIQPYLRGGERDEDTLTFKELEGRCIVYWTHHEEEGWSPGEPNGGLDSLVSIRERLMRGDYRALFLGWLADFKPDEWLAPEDGGALMPPIPAELGNLDAALQALLKHFAVDTDALAVAAELSQAQSPERIPMATVLEQLSVTHMRALLARVADGNGPAIMHELNQLTNPPTQKTKAPAIRCIDFAAHVLKARASRVKKEARAQAAKREREDELRQQHLASIMRRADSLWSSLDPLMNNKVDWAYQQVATQLKELRDAYAQAGQVSLFQEKISGFRRRYSNRPAMLRRIDKL